MGGREGRWVGTRAKPGNQLSVIKLNTVTVTLYGGCMFAGRKYISISTRVILLTS